ncbi:MAG TPA: family 20 glycosylhydrolase [Pedobacter sp.]|nr:family 20 glycosylhydrolase [Pedobacter sp.]
MNSIKYLLSVFLIFCCTYIHGQITLPVYPEATFSTLYWQNVTHFETIPKKDNLSVFIGDSITDGAEWSNLFNNASVVNMGISGDISAGLINRLPDIVKRKPKKIFILIGINDLARNISVDSIYKNIKLGVNYIKQESANTEIFVQSIMPINNEFKTFSAHTSKRSSVIELNKKLAVAANSYTFINLYPWFCDHNGKLKKEFTNDGLHLKGAGYALWQHLVYPYVFGLQQEAAVIPKPKMRVNAKELFPLYKVKQISYTSDSLKTEALLVQKSLATLGIKATIGKNLPNIGSPFIKLEIGGLIPVDKNKEAYHLKVDSEKIVVRANTRTGIFYGIQTLKQLARDGFFVNAVDIKDSPAFAWRGYMVDVGRNYQSMSLLKQQIDVMAANKLNVFHMHLTEDIAWRLAIKSYPELTSPQYMERNKGMYYTTAEIKELITYCRERSIQFVPEIDMPGHSAAFKRAMKVDMQSDSGLVIVKNILKELCETYDFPYIHIGADEVKITNKNFIPEILAFLKSLNKKVIGWEPGANFNESTIRQLWMDDAGLTGGKTKIQYIDSRHLYLNHMDPLESVVTIYNRQLADVDFGNNEALGATLCLWPDRAVANENDVLRMNGVYPAMLAFAERSWLGKGYKGWVANMNLHGKQALNEFKEFEGRLLDHQKQYFTGLSFPYQEQSTVSWQLYGPYANAGDLKKTFEPENVDFKPDEVLAQQITVGGTIILRHWWAPKIKGALVDPAQNTTWYAFRKIWSDEDTTKDFWIGFGNPSRSQATDSPPAGQWDTHGSAIWLNNALILPPSWLHAGQKGNLEIPLADEGYECRLPTALKLKKGWNIVKVKAPIGSFNGKNWNNPEKWMFTFVEVAKD